MTMKKVIINRKRWGKEALRRESDLKQCCLGFACVAYGVPQEDMVGTEMPRFLSPQNKKRLPEWLKVDLSSTSPKDVAKAAEINDSDTPWAKKEELLKPLFKKHNIQLIFRGKR